LIPKSFNYQAWNIPHARCQEIRNNYRMGSQEYNLYSVPCDNYILHVKYEISDTYRFSYRQSIGYISLFLSPINYRWYFSC